MCAALLSAGLAVGFLVTGVRSVVVAGAGGMAVAHRAQLGSLGLGGDDGALLVAAGITSVVFIGLSGLVLVLDGGLLARRGWGREGLLGVHGVLALVVLPISVGGVFGGAPRAWIGVLAGLVNAAVVVLLVLDATTDDMYRAALLRRERRR